MKNKITDRYFNRGDIYMIDFGKDSSYGIKGERPALLLQNELGNLNSSYGMWIPLTTSENKINKEFPTHTKIKLSLNGEIVNSVALTEGIRPISFSIAKEWMGRASKEEVAKVELALLKATGIVWVD